jgi:hypothetical protein
LIAFRLGSKCRKKKVAGISTTWRSACQLRHLCKQLVSERDQNGRKEPGQFDILHEEADMVRVQCNPVENVDRNVAMEEAIMGQLRAGNPAEVAVADLKKCYDAIKEIRTDYGDAETSIATELAAKCDAVCTKLGRMLRSPVEYDKEGEFVEFRMVTARPK